MVLGGTTCTIWGKSLRKVFSTLCRGGCNLGDENTKGVRCIDKVIKLGIMTVIGRNLDGLRR